MIKDLYKSLIRDTLIGVGQISKSDLDTNHTGEFKLHKV